jgi:hypothetical protein
MNELFPQFASYGIPGLVIAGVLWLACRLIDRGFTFQVPPKKR